jgi:hypothetical protein
MNSNQPLPEEYTDGYVVFMGQRFITDKRALIPRLETEELVKYCLKFLEKNPQIQTIADIGTGERYYSDFSGRENGPTVEGLRHRYESGCAGCGGGELPSNTKCRPCFVILGQLSASGASRRRPGDPGK